MFLGNIGSVEVGETRMFSLSFANLQNASNATYYNQSAKPHLTSAGYALVAACVNSALAAFGLA